MQRQPTRDTGPELAVRRLLHRAGLRYRVDVAPVPGLRRRADLVFGPSRVALFIDGCFWHGCPEHGQRSTHANTGYWAGKVARNQARDRSTDDLLAQAGWLVIRAWEHEDPATVASRVATSVLSRRRPPREIPR
jgi:DNA mismatch endonuclease (patch repair protein)